jgi:hypothetical protein
MVIAAGIIAVAIAFALYGFPGLQRIPGFLSVGRRPMIIATPTKPKRMGSPAAANTRCENPP